MLSLPKQIPIQILRCNICLPNEKKAFQKQPLKTLFGEEMQNKHIAHLGSRILCL